MGVISAVAPIPENLQGREVDCLGRGSAFDQTLVVERLHPPTSRLVFDRPQAHDHGSHPGDAKCSRPMRSARRAAVKAASASPEAFNTREIHTRQFPTSG